MLRAILMAGLAMGASATASAAFADDDVVTIGLILPMTGQSASTGKQEQAGAQLYLQQHGASVAGKTIALIVKDDGGAADVTKRLAQDLIGNDKAKVLMGFGLTPLALAVAPVATGATARASGVRPKPIRTLAWSLPISSCARRLVTSAAPVSSLTISEIFLPATTSPCCWI